MRRKPCRRKPCNLVPPVMCFLCMLLPAVLQDSRLSCV